MVKVHGNFPNDTLIFLCDIYIWGGPLGHIRSKDSGNTITQKFFIFILFFHFRCIFTNKSQKMFF